MNEIIKKRIIIIRNGKSVDFGGGERFVVNLAEELAKDNCETLIVSQSSNLLEFAGDHGVKTTRGKWWAGQNSKLARFLPIYFIWQVILTVWYIGFFTKKRPNAIHIHSKDDFIAATIAGKILGKRVIWTDHGELKTAWKNVEIALRNPIGKMIHSAAKRADKITFFSESERMLVSENLSAGGVVWQKMTVIHKGVVDTANKYTKLTSGKTFKYCICSRLVAQKGIGEAIGAFNKLSKDYTNTKLVIVGDGPESAKFKRDTIGNKDIIFLGHQENPLIDMSSADVFIQPSYHEGLSTALIQASMLSLPIIATAVGGNVEIIHKGTTGILIPPHDALALYEAMKLAYDDKVLRQKIAKGARSQYEDIFQFDHIVTEQFLPLYENTKHKS
ncbi:MAG: glycosyltransferase family 4 protein [Candidatus Saccharibacteria bacterium]